MNFKTTYFLFGALALMVAALAATLRYHGSDARKQGGSDRLFPSLAGKGKDREFTADDITKVVIQRSKPAASEIVLERDGKEWKITAPRPLRAEAIRVNGVIDSILSARIDPEVKSKNLKERGLDSPARVITLHGKERTLKLTIGDVDPGAESALAYVLSSDRGSDKPVAVKKRSIDSALEELGFFRSKELLGEGTSDIVGITLADTKKGTVELARDNDRWRFVQPSYGDANVDSALLNQIRDLNVDYRDDKDNDFVQDGVEDLAKIDPDLPKSDQLRITVLRGKDVKSATKSQVVVLTGKKLTSKPKLGPPVEKYYAYLDDGKAKDVVKVEVKNVEPFSKVLDDPSSLRSKNLLALEIGRAPDAIDIKNSYGDLEFRNAGLSWTLYRGGSSLPTDAAEVRSLLEALSRPGQVASFPDPKRKKELGLEKPDLVVKVWVDSLEKAEKQAKPALKKDAKVNTELRFGNREGANVAVERVWGTDSTIVMVPGALVDQLRKGPLAYHDRSIPPFSEGIVPDQDVTRIEIVRGSETAEVTRDKPTSPWVIQKPARLKGRNASEPIVREILTDLNRPRVREVVAEKADAAQAKEYGLTSPTAKVTVTLTKDKKDTKIEYDIGKEANKGYYVRVSGKETIYLVDAGILDGLKKELRDPTVFSFDPDKVVSIKVTGWKSLLGGAETRTLDKKDGKWVCKEKPALTIDGDKVRPALDRLAKLQAEKFVPSGKGLKLDEDALQIEVTTEDKKAHELTVGGEDGLAYFATSKSLEGEVFLVSKALFESVKKGPAWFVK